MRKELARYRGKETNATGDGFFVTFDGPARAVMKPIPITRRRGTGAHCTHRLFFRNIVDRIGKTTSLISSPEYFFSLHPVSCAYPPCWRELLRPSRSCSNYESSLRRQIFSRSCQDS